MKSIEVASVRAAGEWVDHEYEIGGRLDEEAVDEASRQFVIGMGEEAASLPGCPFDTMRWAFRFAAQIRILLGDADKKGATE